MLLHEKFLRKKWVERFRWTDSRDSGRRVNPENPCLEISVHWYLLFPLAGFVPGLNRNDRTSAPMGFDLAAFAMARTVNVRRMKDQCG
jgi:hypothetical protein